MQNIYKISMDAQKARVSVASTIHVTTHPVSPKAMRPSRLELEAVCLEDVNQVLIDKKSMDKPISFVCL